MVEGNNIKGSVDRHFWRGMPNSRNREKSFDHPTKW